MCTEGDPFLTLSTKCYCPPQRTEGTPDSQLAYSCIIRGGPRAQYFRRHICHASCSAQMLASYTLTLSSNWHSTKPLRAPSTSTGLLPSAARTAWHNLTRETHAMAYGYGAVRQPRMAQRTTARWELGGQNAA